jgi:TM2 domain-containing membrane protein YozV
MNDVTTPPRVESNSEFFPTFLLCLFLGFFGAHRFYNKKMETGIAQALTFGGLGIWALADLILILCGKFKDRNGVPIENTNPKVSWTIFVILIVIGVATDHMR